MAAIERWPLYAVAYIRTHVRTYITSYVPCISALFLWPEQVGAYDNGNVADAHLGDFRILGELMEEGTKIPAWKNRCMYVIMASYHLHTTSELGKTLNRTVVSLISGVNLL